MLRPFLKRRKKGSVGWILLYSGVLKTNQHLFFFTDYQQIDAYIGYESGAAKYGLTTFCTLLGSAYNLKFKFLKESTSGVITRFLDVLPPCRS